MRRREFLIGASALAVAPSSLAAQDLKRKDWATPITLPGVPNLYQVSPDLYRSAQPTAIGFGGMQQQLGIKTVLSLREFHSDAELAAHTQLRLQSVPMLTFSFTAEQVVQALKIVIAAHRTDKVLVHCEHGADRTGLVMAMFRVVAQQWDKEKAIAELENGGFGFHPIFFNIPSFIRQADIARFRQALAISL